LTLTAPPPFSRRYTFVTVVFSDDDGLMTLQARSLRRYLDASLVDRIIVIESPHRAHAYGRQDALRREYGALARRVRFVDVRRVAGIPRYVSGWFAQQILKLLVARIIRTERYVVLDAKNHLVAPWQRGHLEAPSGRMRLRPMNYTENVMRPYFESTLASLGVDARPHLERFVPTTTPFTFPTADVRELVDRIEQREGKPFEIAFGDGGFNRTEFFLFGAHLIASGRAIDDVYELSGPKNYTVWPELTTAGILAVLQASEADGNPMFATHRRAIATMSEESRDALAAYWLRHGLFASRSSAERFLRTFARETERGRRSTSHVWRVAR
jgi:hypothetical protein